MVPACPKYPQRICTRKSGRHGVHPHCQRSFLQAGDARQRTLGNALAIWWNNVPGLSQGHNSANTIAGLGGQNAREGDSTVSKALSQGSMGKTVRRSHRFRVVMQSHRSIQRLASENERTFPHSVSRLNMDVRVNANLTEPCTFRKLGKVMRRRCIVLKERR